MKSIKTERIRLGMTQHQLADLIGIPFRTIQNWETGQRKCPEYVEKLVLEKLHRMGESDREHAEWKHKDHAGISIEGFMVCSACNVMIPNCENNRWCLPRLNFCPHCGAKMEKEKKG